MGDYQFNEMVIASLEELHRKLDHISFVLRYISVKEANVSAELDALKAQVTETTTIEQSAITLLQGLAAQIEALKNDPAALAALANDLHSSSDALAAAVQANTPPAAAAPPQEPPLLNV